MSDRRKVYSELMPRKPKPPPDDPAESKRFIEMAREIGADETQKGREVFERVFDRLAPAKERSARPPRRGKITTRRK
jgi:hypothetical protein